MGGPSTTDLSTIKSGWKDLPFEICVRILSLLEPPNVVRLRRVSKGFLDLTLERSLWVEALNHRCGKYNTTLPFPISPTTEIGQIESAVTASYRFLARLNSPTANDESETHLQPTANRLIPRHYRENPGHGAYFSRISLIPGGRYLLTIFNGVQIQLWDLYDLGSSEADPTPIGALRAQQGCRYTIVQGAAAFSDLESDGQTVMYAVTQVQDQANVATYELYKIKAASNSGGDARFDKVGTLPADILDFHPSCRIHPVYKCVVINSSNNKVILWNYQDDTVAAIPMPDCPSHIQASKLAIYKDYLTRWKDGELVFYQLPQFHPRANANLDEAVERYTEVFKGPIRYPTSNPSSALTDYFFSWDEPERHSEHALHLNVVGLIRCTTTPRHNIVSNVTSYRISSLEDILTSSFPPHPSLDAITDVDTEITPVKVNRTGEIPMPSFPSQDRIFLYTNIFTGIKVSPFSSTGKNRVFSVWNRRNDASPVYLGMMDLLAFCACSSRLCVVTDSGIRVLDFA